MLIRCVFFIFEKLKLKDMAGGRGFSFEIWHDWGVPCVRAREVVVVGKVVRELTHQVEDATVMAKSLWIVG